MRVALLAYAAALVVSLLVLAWSRPGPRTAIESRRAHRGVDARIVGYAGRPGRVHRGTIAWAGDGLRFVGAGGPQFDLPADFPPARTGSDVSLRAGSWQEWVYEDGAGIRYVVGVRTRELALLQAIWTNRRPATAWWRRLRLTRLPAVCAGFACLLGGVWLVDSMSLTNPVPGGAAALVVAAAALVPLGVDVARAWVAQRHDVVRLGTFDQPTGPPRSPGSPGSPH